MKPMRCHGPVSAAQARGAQRRWVMLVCISVAATAASLVLARAFAQPPPDAPALVTIKELMEKTITPATNTIWNAYDPPAGDAQWVALEEAAVTLLAAATVTSLGGTGPMDNEWVKQPAWKAFNQAMVQAGADALAAIRARDHAALLVAADVLYPPCEGCHEQFNPGVVGAQQ